MKSLSCSTTHRDAEPKYYQQSQCARCYSPSPNYDDTIQTVEAEPLEKGRDLRYNFHSPLGVRSHQLLLWLLKHLVAARARPPALQTFAGSLHPDEKPLSAKLRGCHGLGVDVALLQLGFDVADLEHMLFPRYTARARNFHSELAISANFTPKITNTRATSTSEYASSRIHSDNSRTLERSHVPRSA